MNAAMLDTMCKTPAHVAAMIDHLPPTFRILRAADYRRMRWKNGAGQTSEILRVPDVEDWDWRLSIADIETDAAFSVFPGVERQLVLLGGHGLRLRFDDGLVHELLQPHGALHFSGERPLVGELLDGPTRDFNVMWKRGAVEAQLWRRPLVGPMVLFVAPGETWVVHQLAGSMQCSMEAHVGEMEAGDTAVLEPGSGKRTRYALDGNGEVLLLRVSRLEA